MYLRFLIMLLCLQAVPLRAAAPALICEQAAVAVAAESGVPVDILGPLTLTETGRRLDGALRPWAWAVNVGGKGVWFDDGPEAMDFVMQQVGAGRKNIDIGCFQINYRWHGDKFASLAEMFDPLANTRYAADFLRQLYQETGDWRLAAGAFHSRRPADAGRYLARFDQLRTAFIDRGFHGDTGGRSYNDFDVADLVIRQRTRKVAMLLGAETGTQPDGGAGSLAVMGAGRGHVLRSGRRGGLLGPGGAGKLFD